MAPLGLLATMVRAGIIAPLRPDRYLRIAAVARREGLSVTSGFAMSAQRCPNRPALIDELGTLTYRQLDQRGDALAFALQGLPGGTPAHRRGRSDLRPQLQPLRRLHLRRGQELPRGLHGIG
jgi:non-ribosomal peptide synthetase component F